MKTIEYGRSNAESPIVQLVGKVIKVTSGKITIVSVLTQVGQHFRVAYGPVRIDFLESDVLNYDEHSIVVSS